MKITWLFQIIMDYRNVIFVMRNLLKIRNSMSKDISIKCSELAKKISEDDARKKFHLNYSAQHIIFAYWIKSFRNDAAITFVAAQEIARRGKPFSDGEYWKEQASL